MLFLWKNRRLELALPQSGKPGDPPYFGSDVVVVLTDAHNGLHMRNNEYTGLKYVSPIGQHLIPGYSQLMDELYGYSDCAERCQMDVRLDEEAGACAVLARSNGIIPYSLSNLKESIKHLLLGMDSGGQR